MRRLLRTDGSMREIDHALSMREIDELIGAQLTDTVMLRHMHTPHAMIVDDNGWEIQVRERVLPDGTSHIELVPVTPRKPINQLGTELYLLQCKPGTTHQIVGDVYICHDSDFDDDQPPHRGRARVRGAGAR